MPYHSHYDSPSLSYNDGQSTILKSASGNIVSSPGGSEESFNPFFGQPMFGGVGQGAPLNEHSQYIYSKVGMPVVPSLPQSVAYGHPTVMTSESLKPNCLLITAEPWYRKWHSWGCCDLDQFEKTAFRRSWSRSSATGKSTYNLVAKILSFSKMPVHRFGGNLSNPCRAKSTPVFTQSSTLNS